MNSEILKTILLWISIVTNLFLQYEMYQLLQENARYIDWIERLKTRIEELKGLIK